MIRPFAFPLIAAALAGYAVQTTAQEPSARPKDAAPVEPRIPRGAIQIHDDDKPAFPEPPAGWDARREDIPHVVTQEVCPLALSSKGVLELGQSFR